MTYFVNGLHLKFILNVRGSKCKCTTLKIVPSYHKHFNNILLIHAEFRQQQEQK